MIGFAMGVGEVVRYLATYGSDRVSEAILLAPLQPFLLQTPYNPDGIPGRFFDGIMQAIVADRPAYISEFLNNCYNVDLLGSSRVSDDAIHLSWTVLSMLQKKDDTSRLIRQTGPSTTAAVRC